MPVEPGTRLGPYEILSPIGAGGMGEVFKAKDTRLDRIVAVKILPSHLSANPQLRERFDREARAISALSHPHICTLHDVGHQDGIDYLVMEHLEGESLADRLTRGPLPVDQVIRYGAQIADALAKAHKHGIVHRDLKPGNVMITKSGAKLLDFGLAKSSAVVPTSVTSLPDYGATEHKPLTAEGTILGTFQYMAPEQLEGLESDARTDIFALGVLLYEMATGHRAFEGKTKTSLIASIVGGEPRPVKELQPLTPPALEHVIEKSLEKDPDDRWQSAHDVAEELRWIGEAGSQTGVAAPLTKKRKQRERLLAAIAAGGVITSMLLGYALWRQQSQPSRVIRSSIVAPPSTRFLLAEDDASALSVSPDGRYLTFSAADANDRQQLWIRSLESGEARPISGSEEGYSPFWSPDSKAIAFFASRKLKRVDISGGPAVTIADARSGRGGTWGSDGTIVFEPYWRDPLYRVPAGGGKAIPVTKLKDSEQETTHRWPSFLPDGRHFLYLAGSHRTPADSDVNAIYIGSLDSEERTLLLRARSNAVYVPGFVLFVRENYLMAQPFDASKRKLEGDPVRLAENVTTVPGFFRALFAASHEGTLAYFTGPAHGEIQLKWLDRSGKELSKLATLDHVHSFRFSPDGSRLLVSIGDPQDLWLLDVARGNLTRFTSEAMGDWGGVWSPEGSRIIFTSDRRGYNELFEKPVNGLTRERPLFELPDTDFNSSDWSIDGKHVIMEAHDRKTSQSDIWLLPMSGNSKPVPFIATEFDERNPLFSPDGKWVTFVSNESGRDEVYAVPFPDRGEKRQLTTGGSYHRWRADGQEILYAGPERALMSIEVRNGTFAQPRQLMKFTTDVLDLEVTRDGSRLLVAELQKIEPSPVTLVTNWTGSLGK